MSANQCQVKEALVRGERPVAGEQELWKMVKRLEESFREKGVELLGAAGVFYCLPPRPWGLDSRVFYADRWGW